MEKEPRLYINNVMKDKKLALIMIIIVILIITLIYDVVVNTSDYYARNILYTHFREDN